MAKKWEFRGHYVIIFGGEVEHCIPFTTFTKPNGCILFPSGENECSLNPYNMPIKGFGGTCIIPLSLDEANEMIDAVFHEVYGDAWMMYRASNINFLW